MNKNVDIRKFLIDKVQSGKIKPTEEAIRKKAEKVFTGQNKNTIDTIIQQVMTASGIEQPFEIYTSTPKVQDWLDNHSKVDYFISGNYDKERDMYGMSQKEGYLYRAIHQSIARYRKTGKKTYVIFYCDAPTGKATLLKKRLGILESFNEHMLDLQSVGIDPSKVPLVIMGFLPQERGVEDWKRLITVDEVKASLPLNSVFGP